MSAPDIAAYQESLREKYAHLIGKRLVPDHVQNVPDGAFRAQDVEGRDPGGGWVRVVTPHTAITKDMRQERLNVHVGEDGVVNEFRFY